MRRSRRRDAPAQVVGASRVPAAELENLVCGRLRRFLASDSEMFDHLWDLCTGRQFFRPMVTSARTLAETWSSLGVREITNIFETLAVEVVLHDEHVEAVSKTRSRLVLQTN